MSKQDIERALYALANPWVFQYNFGHIELVRKYISSIEKDLYAAKLFKEPFREFGF